MLFTWLLATSSRIGELSAITFQNLFTYDFINTTVLDSATTTRVPAIGFLYNDSKTNADGHVEVSALIPHRNPLRDPVTRAFLYLIHIPFSAGRDPYTVAQVNHMSDSFHLEHKIPDFSALLQTALFPSLVSPDVRLDVGADDESPLSACLLSSPPGTCESSKHIPTSCHYSI